MSLFRLESTVKSNDFSNNNHSKKLFKNSFRFGLSSLIIMMIFFLGLLPFGQLWHLRLGFIVFNLSELAHITIGFLLILHIGKLGINREFSFPFLLSTILFIIYGFASMFFADASFGDVFRQSRRYIPFFIAGLILASKISYNIELFSHGMAIVALISSVSALGLHFIFPQIIEDSFLAANAEEVLQIASAGRMQWENSSLVYFVIAIFYSSSKKTILLWTTLISVFIALITTVSRTDLIFSGIFIMILQGVSPITARDKIKNLALFTLFFAAVIVLANYLFSYDNRLYELFSSRFLGQGSLDAVYEESILRNRLSYYEQYWEKIVNYFPMGQGLGQPLAISLHGDYINVTDISFIAFFLPFGIPGLIIFFIFIKNIFALIKKSLGNSYFSTRFRNALFIMTWIFILASLNDDIFSRKNGVIYLAIFSVLIYSNNSRKIVGKR